MGSEGLKTRKQERFSCTMRTVLDTVSRLNMNRLLRASLLIRLLAASAQVAAMQPLITDDTATQGLGGRQLEASLCDERSGASGGHSASLPLTLSWGARDDLDLSLATTYIRSRAEAPVSAWGNPVLGAKWRLLGGATSLALKPELLLASGDAASGPDRTSGRIALLLSLTLPFGFIHVNLALARERYGDPALGANRARFSLAPVWDLAARWKLVADSGLERVRSDGGRRLVRFAELGAVWSPRQDLDLALGLVRSLDDQSPRQGTNSATFGASLRF